MVQENSLKKVLVICGPTASGKTALAVECAKMLGSEVVSADSMCVYRGCDIGTAKPAIDEMCDVKHHLIDVVDPTQSFSVGDYRDLALPIIDDIIQRGKIPVVCGGTGFYINSILYDLSYGNSCADGSVREYCEKYLEQNGKAALHALLEEKDPESAAILHENDTRRVIRALEIFFVTGKKKSDIKDDFMPRYDYKSFSVDFPRGVLYERINKRVDIMIENGLMDEVKRLMDNGITDEHQCMQGIGYKEVFFGLKQGLSVEEIAESIKFNTRHYAKRQITFFKRDERLELLPPSDASTLADSIIRKLQ